MYTFEVSGFPEYVDIEIRCPKCRQAMEERIFIPAPNWSAEKDCFSATSNDEYYTLCCSCGENIEVQATGSCSGNFIYFQDVEDEDIISIQGKYNPDEMDWKPNPDYFTAFLVSMNEITTIRNNACSTLPQPSPPQPQVLQYH